MEIFLNSLRYALESQLKNELSVITPCFNDFLRFSETLASLRGELRVGDELVVVDSSGDKKKASNLILKAGLSCNVTQLWVPPEGVYRALNAGVLAAKKDWIQIINSGDGMMPGARDELTKTLDGSPKVLIHVFSQKAVGAKFSGYIFKPGPKSIWPHQSIVMARSLHDKLGLYDVKMKLASDQIFFAKARRLVAWKIHSPVLTFYDLNGLSSAVSLAASREAYILWRSLGCGRTVSLLKACLMPFMRQILMLVLGPGGVSIVKRLLFSHYKNGGIK